MPAQARRTAACGPWRRRAAGQNHAMPGAKTPLPTPAPTPAPTQRRQSGRWPWLLAAAAAPLAGATLVMAAALQRTPTVQALPDLGPEDVARAVELLRRHDPRQAQPGAVTAARVAQRDIDVLIDQGLHRWLDAAGRVELQRGRARLTLSLRLPELPGAAVFTALPARLFGAWLNLDVQWIETAGLPALDRVRVGRLPLPAVLAERVSLWALQRAGLHKELQLATEVVQQVRFAPQQLSLRYAWQPDSLSRLVDGLLSESELQRLRPYAEHLARLSQQGNTAPERPLVSLLVPMFELARQRSAAGADAAAENRAALLVLALLANGRSTGSLSLAARAWPQPRPLRLLLAGRDDFPRHFLVSAVLATEGTTPLSRAVGLYKEVADSRQGSGFSFNDMAANRAGTRFGERALREPAALQAAVADGLVDADLLPAVDDLPEFMPEPEFIRRFGGVGTPAYRAMLERIDARIDALPLLR